VRRRITSGISRRAGIHSTLLSYSQNESSWDKIAEAHFLSEFSSESL
jgi:hypothetical protein